MNECIFTNRVASCSHFFPDAFSRFRFQNLMKAFARRTQCTQLLPTQNRMRDDRGWISTGRISAPPNGRGRCNQTRAVAPLRLNASEHTIIQSQGQMNLHAETHAKTRSWSPFSSEGSSPPSHLFCVDSSPDPVSRFPQANMQTVTEKLIDHNKSSKQT